MGDHAGVPPPAEIRAVPADGPVATGLVAAMEAELLVVYAGVIVTPLAQTPSATPADFSPPGGVYLAVFADGTPVAGGGIKALEPGLGEIKRMYVVPEARGQGHARRLLGGLEAAAAELGYPCLRLDTGARQPHARALYASAGWHAIADYNGNPYAAHWFEKSLTG